MSKTKCCGNCEYFKEEGADEKGWCTHQSWIAFRESACTCFEPKSNGWTEITTDTENELTDELLNRIIIGFKDCEGRMHTMTLIDCKLGIGTMAKLGCYYFYVLPEIKIE